MSDASLDHLISRLRNAEKIARKRLECGCAEDMANLDNYLDRPLRAAEKDASAILCEAARESRSEVADDADREGFRRIGIRCARLACANLDMRARARFRIYTASFVAIEADIANALVTDRTSRRLFPRMFVIPHLAVGGNRLPEGPRSPSRVCVWSQQLRIDIRIELAAQMRDALSVVLGHGFERLAAVNARINLAFHT